MNEQKYVEINLTDNQELGKICRTESLTKPLCGWSTSDLTSSKCRKNKYNFIFTF